MTRHATAHILARIMAILAAEGPRTSGELAGALVPASCSFERLALALEAGVDGGDLVIVGHAPGDGPRYAIKGRGRAA